jgi:Zn-finger nucleic acid-binding protein
MDEVRKLDIVIDSCARCGGMWLDRGELDKIRATAHEIRREDESRTSGLLGDVARRVANEATSGDRPKHHQKKRKRVKSVSDLLEIFD